jgi:hypothetical protein
MASSALLGRVDVDVDARQVDLLRLPIRDHSLIDQLPAAGKRWG